MSRVEHLRGRTFHGRKGSVANSFSYGIDYVLLDPATADGPSLFSMNAANVMSVRDVDHGGPPGRGAGLAWVRAVLANNGLPGSHNIRLLTQPRVLGHVFNPVSFWLCHDERDALRVVIAEVSNTYGDRHSYLCHRDDGQPLTREDSVIATKIFHVSPFQPIGGGYAFRFDIRADRIGIWIDYTSGDGGLIATLVGDRRPLTNRRILTACLRRPFGSRRVLGLIHWQAMKLWWKGAVFHNRPRPPEEEVTR